MKREELGNDFDEEEEMIKYAKDQLLQTTSNKNLMDTAELLIDEDWCGKVDALPGNIYRLAVMGDIFLKMGGRLGFEEVQQIAKIFGVLTIVAIQIVGPPMIFLSRMYGIGVLNELGYNWHCCPWHPRYDSSLTYDCEYLESSVQDVSMFDDWGHIITTKALGMLMMAAFILNGWFVIADEKNSWKQIYNTLRYLDVKNDNFKLAGMSFLWWDGLINAWVICWCCIDVYLVIGASMAPAEVLMNALGLVFLYNLDDIGGDLGFVNEDDWPGRRLAWIYQEIVHPCDDSEFDEDVLDIPGYIVLGVYNIVIGMLIILTFAVPMLAACTPFIQIVPH